MQPVGIEGAEKLRELAKKCSGTEHDLQYNAGRGGRTWWSEFWKYYSCCGDQSLASR